VTMRDFELPENLEQVQRKAQRIEWLTIAYMTTAIIVLALTLGQSQAMRAAWVEDVLSLLPPAAFLIASRIRNRPASAKFPWGLHRAVSIAYLAAAFALLALGALVFLDSAIKLIKLEHPPIGVIQLFGHEIWLGWLMLAALAYSGIFPVFLGRAKKKLADELHDKVLYADAEMNRADWMTILAAMVGVIGIGIGWWWADGAAALFISVDIVRDGWKNVRAATHDLMDARPRTHDSAEFHPLVDEIEEKIQGLDWVEQGAVRLREEGHVFTGEVLVVPRTEERLMERLAELSEELLEMSWKLYDLVVVPMKEIDVPTPQDTAPEGAEEEAGQESSPGGSAESRATSPR
jgi:cation diffusion facilitator family transporter